MMRRNKILALFLAVILILPVFTFTVSIPAAATVEHSVAIDYVTETIWITPALSGHEGIIVDDTASTAAAAAARLRWNASGQPEFMYAIRAVGTDQAAQLAGRGQGRLLNALSRERWMPIYGGGFDITRIIPTNVRRPFYIAIRCANDIWNTQTGFDSRVAFRIAPRYNNRFNRDLIYDAVNERIMLSQQSLVGPSAGVVFQFDLFSPVTRMLDRTGASNTNIYVPADKFALGAIVNISTAPQTIGGTFFARSRNVRFRIPRQPNAPNARVDSSGTNRRVTGMRASGFEFSLTPPNTPTWVSYTGTATVNFATDNALGALNAAFPNLINQPVVTVEGVDVRRVWVRVAPNQGRAPGSPATLLEIPVSWFE